MLKSFRVLAVCLFFGAMFPCERAHAYGIASDINYSTSIGLLSGYAQTWKEPWDSSYEEYCFEWGYDDWYGWYCSWGATYTYFVYVWAGVFTPAWTLDSSVSVLAWSNAYASFSQYQPAPGIWRVNGEHYKYTLYQEYYCEPPMLGGSCYPVFWTDWYSYLGPTWDQAVVPPPPVQIEYTMLIPLDHLRMPFPWETFFEADSAYSYVTGATYRIQQKFVIDTVNKTVTQLENLSGITRGYTPAEEHLSSSASCFRKNCPECPEYITGRKIVYDGQCRIPENPSCALAATDMNTMAATVTNSSSTSVSVAFEGDPDNACSNVLGMQFAWDISWYNDLTISWDSSSPTYQLTMDHDGFPLHELRINGSLVYDFDPIAAQNTPNALAYPRDVNSGALTGELP